MPLVSAYNSTRAAHGSSSVPKSPARKLVLPNFHKKSCERFLSVEEVQILAAASAREHVLG